MLKNPYPVSEYKRVTFDIDSKYRWGEGWSFADKINFEAEVLNALTEVGFTVQPSDNGRAMIATSQNKFTNLYLHPMEFTGYANKEDILKVVTAIKKCKSCRITSMEGHDCYEISDKHYLDLLKANTPMVRVWLDSYMKTHSDLYEVEVDFIRENRIPRVGDAHGVYSSRDIEWVFLDGLLDELNIKTA